MPAVAREALRNVAATLDAQRAWLAKVLADSAAGTEEGMAELDKLYAEAERSPLPAPLAELRRNVGRQRFAAIFHGLAAAAVGHPQDTGYSSAELDSLLKDAFRLPDEPTHAASSGNQPLDLEFFGKISTAHPAAELADADSVELDCARQDMRALTTFVTAGASLLRHFVGRGAPTLETASRMFSIDRPHEQMLLLLGGLALRTTAEFRNGLEQLRTTLAPQAVAANQMYELVVQLREQIPALAEALSDTHLGEILRDGKARAPTHEQIKRVRSANPGQLDAFFAAHPETDELVETFEKRRDDADS